MAEKNCAIGIFTRSPDVGKVKTRLIPVLGAEKSAQLYRTMIDRTLNTCSHSGITDIELWCYPETDHPFLNECANRFNFPLRLQQGRDLGERMFFAISSMLKEYQYGIITGCDCPGMTSEILDKTCRMLTDGYDVVIGPSMDGGYYLLGCNQAVKELFTDMPWGTSTVFADTRDRIMELNLKFIELEVLHDIDRPEDLEILAADPR